MKLSYLLAIILGISGQSIVKKPYTQKTNGAGVYFFNTLLSAAALLFFVVTSSKFSFDISFIHL